MNPFEQGNTAFALDLYRELRTAPGNLFLSPYSISTALAMTYAGARGETAVQMAQALHFMVDDAHIHPAFGALQDRLHEIASKGHIQLRVANALWPQEGYPLLEAYLDAARQHYGVLITPLDYANDEAARRTINQWVEEQTESRIVDLIPEGVLDALTRLVLVNAIYFKGDWASQFDPHHTKDAPFWVTPAEQVQAPLMTQQEHFRYREGDGFQVLELPYAGEDVSMIVLLPKEIDGLAGLEASLTPETLDKWTRNLWETEVAVYLPRFEITFPFRLDGVLMALGMRDAFSDDADFSGMDGRDKWLYIAAVLHKAFVAVNEEGTEAAAATAVTMAAMSLPPPVPTFRADHPFLFVIRENSTGSILFLGRVVNPA